MLIRPRTPHLVWSATTTTRPAEATSASSVSASSRFGVVNPASALMPCTPMKSTSTWSERSVVTATGPTSASEGVRIAAREDDGEIGPALPVEDVGDLDRVRDHGQVGHAEDVVGEPPGRRPGAEPDRLPRLDELRGRLRDRLLLAQLPVGLGLEARLVGARAAARGRAAVHLLDESRRGERVEVAADRHLGDAEQLGQLAHAHGAVPADLLDDRHLALARKHL